METWLLEDYAEGLLDVAETTLLEAHLAVCPDCRRELSHIKLLFWELESMRREPVPVPDALRRAEGAMLDKWLSDKETWLQQAGNRLKATARETAARMPRMPQIPGADRVAEAAGEASVRAVKWAGRASFRLIRQGMASGANQAENQRHEAVGDKASGKSVLDRTKGLSKALRARLAGGGG